MPWLAGPMGIVLPRGQDLLSQSLRYLRYVLTSFWIIYLAPLLFLKLKLALQATQSPESSRLD